MSSLDYYLSPLTHTTIYLHSHHFRNAHRFVPNSSPIRVLRHANFFKDFKRFDLWRGLKLNNTDLRKGGCGNAATGGQESDSGESGGESKGVEVEPVSGGSGSNRRKEKQGKGGWWWWLGSSKNGGKWKWQSVLKVQEVGVLLLQLGIVVFVMRLLRPGIPLPGSEPRASTSFVSVPYSEFLSKINGDQVQKVEVDGIHIMFKLKGDLEGGEFVSSGSSRLQQESESLVKSVAPTKRIVYTTTRPSDIRTPYEKMLENEVEFGSPDRRSGGFFNSALVSYLCLFMVCYS